MLEVRYHAARALPLGRAAAADAQTHGIRIQPATAEARFSLRVRESVAAAAGFPLDPPINTVSGDDQRWIARLGPDEWLIGLPEAESDLFPASVAGDLGDRPHSLVEVSHRNVGIEISGARAAAALNAGCPLDLGEAAFPAGRATRTLLGKAEIVLIRRDAPIPTYRVECWRSFSTYVHGFLQEAAFGAGESDGRARR